MMTFEKDRLKFVVPIMIIVIVSSTFLLFNKHGDVPSLHKFFIIIGSGLFSAIISYFLFPQDEKRKK